jgi:hypothetical protein
MKSWATIFLLLSGFSWAGDLKLDTAKIDITPSPGIPMGGCFYVQLSTGIASFIDDIF